MKTTEYTPQRRNFRIIETQIRISFACVFRVFHLPDCPFSNDRRYSVIEMAFAFKKISENSSMIESLERRQFVHFDV